VILGRKVNRVRLGNPERKDLVVNVVRRVPVATVARRARPVREVPRVNVARPVRKVPRANAARPGHKDHKVWQVNPVNAVRPARKGPKV
jgi:hypothetical protein